MYSPRLYKYRDSYVLYILTVHTFGTVNFTHTFLAKTHTHDVSAPCPKLGKFPLNLHLHLQCINPQIIEKKLSDRKKNIIFENTISLIQFIRNVSILLQNFTEKNTPFKLTQKFLLPRHPWSEYIHDQILMVSQNQVSSVIPGAINQLFNQLITQLINYSTYQLFIQSINQTFN